LMDEKRWDAPGQMNLRRMRPVLLSEGRGGAGS
jgi:hypothetical protein